MWGGLIKDLLIPRDILPFAHNRKNSEIRSLYGKFNAEQDGDVTPKRRFYELTAPHATS